MKKEDIYSFLEEKMLSYKDYLDVVVSPNGEALFPVPSLLHLRARQIDHRMLALTQNVIYVRKSVLDKLLFVANLLKEESAELSLEVVYGYRTLEIQEKLFEEMKEKLSSQYEKEALIEATHRWIALPQVAGHPTGGAVDVQILQNGAPLDFGTKIWEFSEDSFTFSPFISKTAWQNRQRLRNLMILAGFAPFDGEWWHFSFGDQEWASYYKKPFAIFEQLSFLEMKNLLKNEPN